MALNFAEAKELKFASELIPDKIVYRKEVTYSVPLAAGLTAYTEYVIPHGLPFTPLVLGSYSDDDFVTSYDFGTGPFGYLTTYAIYAFPMQAHAYSDATNITIRVISHNTARTIKFHIIGLTKGLATATAATIVPTPPIQDEFLFNTDHNTLKHVVYTEKVMSTNGLGTYVFHTYAVNSPYVLTPLCWVEEGGRRSFGNTMNTITASGVQFAVDMLPGEPGQLRIGVLDSVITTVNIIIKGYVDA